MTTAVSTRRVLIPAAGFGKRMGEPPAKELLPDPYSGEPMIEFSLHLAADCQARPLVISRKDKRALNDYFTHRSEELIKIASSREWPETLLQAKAKWLETNVVILPDTRFAPRDAPKEIFRLLESGASVVFAVFSAPDLSTWGVIAEDKGEFVLCEKPLNELANAGARPWGLFGFRKNAGEKLLNGFLSSGEDRSWYPLDDVPKIIQLTAFEDLTRIS